jgi:hypothetical protein
LQKAIGLDGGFVAATGARKPPRRVARRLGITLIDLQTIGREGALIPSSWIALSAAGFSLPGSRSVSTALLQCGDL